MDTVEEHLWPIANIALAMSWESNHPEDVRAAVDAMSQTYEKSFDFLLSLHDAIPKANPKKCPKWLTLCGCYYSAYSIEIYVHYPQWDPTTKKWQVVSQRACVRCTDLLAPKHPGRFQYLFRILLIMQRNLYAVRKGVNTWMRKYGDIFRERGLFENSGTKSSITTSSALTT